MSDRGLSGNTHGVFSLQLIFYIAASYIRIDLLNKRHFAKGVPFRERHQSQLIHYKRDLSSAQRTPEMVELFECQCIELQCKAYRNDVRVIAELARCRCAI